MYKRDYFHNKAVKSKDVRLWEQYKCARNGVVHAIEDAQKSYYHNEVHVNAGSKTHMWKAMRDILGQPTSVASNNISPDGFNDYFATIGTKLAEKSDGSPHKCQLPRSMYSFDLQLVDVSFVHKHLLLSKHRSNMDILSIDCKLLKLGAGAIAPSLCNIFNLSVSSGELPL